MIGEMRAAIFDLDGVIVDTAKYHYLAWKRLANVNGFDFTEADNERLKGVSRVRSLEILLEIGGVIVDDNTRQQMAAFKNDWYVAYINRLTPSEILPGADEYLRFLKRHHIKVALGSASKNAALVLDRLAIRQLFDVVVDGNQVRQSKPHPEVFLRAAEAVGVPPTACIVFEDAESGVAAAIRAGMGCVGIGAATILKEADVIVGSLNQLTTLALIRS